MATKTSVRVVLGPNVKWQNESDTVTVFEELKLNERSHRGADNRKFE